MRADRTTMRRTCSTMVVAALLVAGCGGGDEETAPGEDDQQAQEFGQLQEPEAAGDAAAVADEAGSVAPDPVSSPGRDSTATPWTPLGARFEWCAALQHSRDSHDASLAAVLQAVEAHNQALAAANSATDELDRAAALEQLDALGDRADDAISRYHDSNDGDSRAFVRELRLLSGDAGGSKGVAYNRAWEAFVAAGEPQQQALLAHFGAFFYLTPSENRPSVSPPAVVAAAAALLDAFEGVESPTFSVGYDTEAVYGVMDAVDAVYDELIAGPLAQADAKMPYTSFDQEILQTRRPLFDAAAELPDANEQALRVIRPSISEVYSDYRISGAAAAAPAAPDNPIEATDAGEAFDWLLDQIAAVRATSDEMFAALPQALYDRAARGEADVSAEVYAAAVADIDDAVASLPAVKADVDAAFDAAAAAVDEGPAGVAAAVEAAHAAGAAVAAASDTARRVVPAAGPASAAATETLLAPDSEIRLNRSRRFFAAATAVDSLMGSESWQALHAALAEACQP